MPANINPIFTAAADIQWPATPLTAANSTKDGASGTVTTVFTADATNGGYVTKLIARALGTNVATVLRVFVNNGAVTTTAANNALIAEMTLPATTLSEVAAQPAYELPLGFALPAGYRLFCAIGTAVAAGYGLSVTGGKY
jgi:hypothetical protein